MKTAATLFIGLGLLTFSLSGTSDSKSKIEHLPPVPLKPVEVVKPAVVEVKAPALPASINYVSEKEAVASGKIRFYHVTDSKTCAPCRLAKGFMSTPAFIKASQEFACVLIDRAAVPKAQFDKWVRYYGVTLMPAEVFVSPDGKRKVAYNGLPHTAPATGTAYYLQILNIGRKEVTGKVVEPLTPTAIKNVVQKNLIPTLAATKPPQTQTVVEGRQRSVVVVRTPPRASYAPCAGGRSNCSGMRTRSPGFIGRATFRPQPLFRR